MNTAMNTELTVAAWPGLVPRLLRSNVGGETHADYRGYLPLIDAGALLEEVRRAGVLGRGGAGFPMAVKMSTVRAAATSWPGHRAGRQR